MVDRDLRTGEIKQRIKLPPGEWRLLSRNLIYRYSTTFNGIAVTSLDSDEAPREVEFPSTKLMWTSPSETRVAYQTGSESHVRVHELGNDREIQLGEKPLIVTTDLQWSPNEQWIMTVGGGQPSDGGTLAYAGWVQLFDAGSGDPVNRARIGIDRILGSTGDWSPDSKTFVAGSQDGTCQVYETPRT